MAATVPGGQTMTINVNGQQMAVQVPMGVQPGQNFSFQVAAPEPQVAMAQPVYSGAVGVQMAQPVTQAFTSPAILKQLQTASK